MKKNVLLISNELVSKELLIDQLRKRGLRLFTVTEAARAKVLLREKEFACIFVDLASLRALKQCSAKIRGAAVICLGACSPREDRASLAAVLKLPLEQKSIERVLARWTEGNVRIVAKSKVMGQVLHKIDKIARCRSNVFIVGESGTGKEVIASQIHALSERAHAPFIKVNCAAVPDTLMESEFFGHEKGAFTGAFARKVGRFERADCGTLLLDEVSEIPARLQAKLLRVIQEQELERLGSTAPVTVDVRMISTSNQNMEEALRERRFREDLYYRLNVIPLFLPPLRERREDIIPLAQQLVRELCFANHWAEKTLSSSAYDQLLTHQWPGNVRELRNVLEHSLAMTEKESVNTVVFDPVSVARAEHNIRPVTLKEVEKTHILTLFNANQRHQAKTAAQLGISVRTLRNKLKLYRLQ